jgi:hypothetical protein
VERQSRHSPLPLLQSLQGQLQRCQQQLHHEKKWHAKLPVLLLNRCWLKLETLTVSQLLARLPVDSSAHAPELVRFRQLMNVGLAVAEAEQSCWEEFGADACHLALRRYWQEQQQPQQLWSLEEYLALMGRYRQGIEAGLAELPLLLMPRPQDPQRLSCHWYPGLAPDDAPH